MFREGKESKDSGWGEKKRMVDMQLERRMTTHTVEKAMMKSITWQANLKKSDFKIVSILNTNPLIPPPQTPS